MESDDERIDVIVEDGLVTKMSSKEIINLLTMPFDSDDELGHLLFEGEVGEEVDIPEDFLPPLQDGPPEHTNNFQPITLNNSENSDITDSEFVVSQRQASAAVLSPENNGSIPINKNKQQKKKVKMSWQKKS